jgi:hypothetical protein
MRNEMPQATCETARCLRPGCGRKLTSPESVARGMGRHCARLVREAARTADLSAWTPAQVEEALQAIEDGAVVPSGREGVLLVVSVDGSEVHRVHRDGCNCVNGLKSRPSRPCWHRCLAVMVLGATAPAPVAPVIPLPRAAAPADVWSALEALGATGTADFIPAF